MTECCFLAIVSSAAFSSDTTNEQSQWIRRKKKLHTYLQKHTKLPQSHVHEFSYPIIFLVSRVKLSDTPNHPSITPKTQKFTFCSYGLMYPSKHISDSDITQRKGSCVCVKFYGTRISKRSSASESRDEGWENSILTRSRPQCKQGLLKISLFRRQELRSLSQTNYRFS